MQKLELIDLVIIAHKRSLGQGNIFTGVCLSSEGYDVTSCLAAWYHVPYRDSASEERGGCPGGLMGGGQGWGLG